MTTSDEATVVAAALMDATLRIPARQFPRGLGDLDLPGLYAWFVDRSGAEALSAGLGHDVGEGLIYAGQTGAGASSASLRSRIGGNHLSGRIRGSTFRFTLASVLAAPLGLAGTRQKQLLGDGEARLSAWMVDHLSVAVFAIADRLRIATLERAVLRHLDPPLNLETMGDSDLRLALSRLRAALLAGAAGDAPPHTSLPVEPPRAISGTPTRGTPGRAAPDMARHIEGLVGTTIPTMTGCPNRILRTDGTTVWVGTEKSPNGQPVEIADVQDAADRLFARGELAIDVPTVGRRSAFIGAVLATLPGTVSLLNPRRIVLQDPPGGA